MYFCILNISSCADMVGGRKIKTYFIIYYT